MNGIINILSCQLVIDNVAYNCIDWVQGCDISVFKEEKEEKIISQNKEARIGHLPDSRIGHVQSLRICIQS